MTEYPSSQKGHTKDSNNGFKRAITKTTTYLQKSNILNSRGKTKLLAPIHGGKNLSLVTRSLEQILDFDVDGLVICDICAQ